jgi:hypothetical protein
MLKALIVIALMGASFVAGYARSTAVHGDWMLVRTNTGCGAYDPDRAALAGEWVSPDPSHCRMRDFIWRKLLSW